MRRPPRLRRSLAQTTRLARLIPILALLLNGCFSSAGVGPAAHRPLETVDAVDLERFAGRWFVIESIGTSAEDGAHDAVETYHLREDGRIDIDFRFHAGSFDGPIESIPQLGWVHDARTRAEWRVRPVWPLALAYLILDLDPEYAYTVVGHPSKRWVWIMARSPELAEDTLIRIRADLAAFGYDVDRLQRVPQRPLSDPERL
jgi:apolipoprotein D and lipocalin family protein